MIDALVFLLFLMMLLIIFMDDLRRQNQDKLNIFGSSEKIQPKKLNFLFSWYLTFLSFSIPAALASLLIYKPLGISILELWIITSIMWSMAAIPAYPYYTLVVEPNKLVGSSLWGIKWKRLEMKSSDVDKEKVLHQIIGRKLGITIFHSREGKKILTLGLDNFQLMHLFEILDEQI